MPFARIDLVAGKSAEFRRTVGEIVYGAIVEILRAPVNDRFQVITEHPEDDLIADETFFGIRRTKGCIFIQLTLNAGRSVEQKKDFYKAVATGLNERLGVRIEDVFINMVEATKENWSFGNGEAQLA